MKAMNSNDLRSLVCGVAVAGALAAAGFTPTSAHASVVQCGTTTCASTFSLLVNGADVGGGQLIYDAASGAIALDTTTFRGSAVPNGSGGLYWAVGENHVLMNALSGNADPILGFSVGATTGSTPSTFSFVFSLPVALDGSILAMSSLSYSLTGFGATNARVTPLVGGKTLNAYEIDADGPGLPGVGAVLDKGVSIGDMFALGSSPLTGNSPIYTGSNTFTGSALYDLMSVNLAFTLTQNSSVGMSGFVQQTIVPLPAALPLLLSGLAGLVVAVRRRGALPA
jgi:hypothetical protein